MQTFTGTKRARTGAYKTPVAKRSRTGKATSAVMKYTRTPSRFRAYGRVPRYLGNAQPDNILVKFKASDIWNFTYATPGVSDFMWMYGNNPYDPIHGASTTACAGYAQYMAMYNKCVTYATKITVGFVQTTNNASELYGYVHHDISTTSLARVLTQSEVVEASLKHFKYCLVTSTNITQQVQPVWVRMFARIKDVEQKTELEPSIYSCGAASGPTNLTALLIGLVHVGSALTDGFAIRAIINVTYYCKLLDKKPLGA